MNFKALISLLPTLYAVSIGLASIHIVGFEGMLAILSIGIGASLLLASFFVKKRK